MEVAFQLMMFSTSYLVTLNSSQLRSAHSSSTLMAIGSESILGSLSLRKS